MVEVTQRVVDEIGHKSDASLQEWERIMKVNKIMLDLSVRKLIEDLVQPCFDHSNRLEKEIMVQIREEVKKAC